MYLEWGEMVFSRDAFDVIKHAWLHFTKPQHRVQATCFFTDSSVTLYVCVHRWLCCVCFFGYVHVCGCMEARSWHWASCSVTCHLIFWSRVSHWIWSSLVSLDAWPMGSWDLLLCPHPQCWDYSHTLHPAFYIGTGEPILGPQASMAGN